MLVVQASLSMVLRSGSPQGLRQHLYQVLTSSLFLCVHAHTGTWPGGLVCRNIVPYTKRWRFNSRSGHVREAIKRCFSLT